MALDPVIIYNETPEKLQVSIIHGKPKYYTLFSATMLSIAFLMIQLYVAKTYWSSEKAAYLLVMLAIVYSVAAIYWINIAQYLRKEIIIITKSQIILQTKNIFNHTLTFPLNEITNLSYQKPISNNELDKLNSGLLSPEEVMMVPDNRRLGFVYKGKAIRFCDNIEKNDALELLEKINNRNQVHSI